MLSELVAASRPTMVVVNLTLPPSHMLLLASWLLRVLHCSVLARLAFHAPQICLPSSSMSSNLIASSQVTGYPSDKLE